MILNVPMWVSTMKCQHNLLLRNTLFLTFCPFLQHLYSASVWKLCSDWSVFVTSQPHGSPDCSFSCTVSKHKLCTFLCWLNIVILYSTAPRPALLWKKTGNLTFYIMAPSMSEMFVFLIQPTCYKNLLRVNPNESEIMLKWQRCCCIYPVNQ